MYSEIKGLEIHLLIDKDIYNEDVLHKCFYWYTSSFNVSISFHAKKQFLVILQSKSQSTNLEVVLEKIKQDLIDFKLRDIVTKETKVVRELIVAKAFAYYGLEENPITDASDPVGFNPESINESNSLKQNEE